MERAHGDEHRARAVRRGDRIHLGHVFLAGSMAFWRIVAATPELAAARCGAFESSAFGHALALITLIGGVCALAVVLVGSAAQWRDARTSGLALLLVLALTWRRELGVFDLAYLALTAVLAVLWFHDGRTRLTRARGAVRS